MGQISFKNKMKEWVKSQSFVLFCQNVSLIYGTIICRKLLDNGTEKRPILKVSHCL